MPANLAIHRLSARTPARAEAVAARLALQALGADLEDALPRGLPPQALLWLRRMQLQAPEAALLRPVPAAWRQGWVAAGRECFDTALAQAARPALGPVPESAPAVLFADAAEMLACLALAAQSGQLDHWWWRGLLGRAWPHWQTAWAARPEAQSGAQRLLARVGQGGLAAPWMAARPDLQARDAPVPAGGPWAAEATRSDPGGAVASMPAASATAPRREPDVDVAHPSGEAPRSAQAPSSQDPVRAAKPAGAFVPWPASPVQAELPQVPVTQQLESAVPLGRAAHVVQLEAPFGAEGQPSTDRLPPTNLAAPGERSVEAAQPSGPKPSAPALLMPPIASLPASAPAPAARLPSPGAPMSPVACAPTEPQPPVAALDGRGARPARAPAPQDRPAAAIAPAPLAAPPMAPAEGAAAFWPWPEAVLTRQAPLFFIVNALLEDGLYPDFTRPRDPGLPVPLWGLLAALSRAWHLPDDPLPAALAERCPDWIAPEAMPAVPGAAAGPWTAWLAAYARSLRRRLCGRLGLRAAAWPQAMTLARPARLWLSEAEWVVEFDLSAHDVAWRLAGLDRDPGWLPSAGCSLRFVFV